ncbi:hypothetical protein D6D03_10765 [Aureobasidium pullulans]|nr:hypothetical protein D6D03_10765 [Aureobasidium pullulans]
MPSTRAPPKQPNDAVEDTQSIKRQRHEPDLLEGVDVFADRLSTKVVLGDSVGIHQSWTEH